MRVITGGICHETSTFTTVETTIENFKTQRVGILRGDAVLEAFRGCNTPIGGFIDGAEKHGFELVPTLFANAHPSGPVSKSDLDVLLGDMLDRTRKAGKVDGVLLELHGSMTAEGLDDAEGYILQSMREVVGPDVPILAELDIHSNVSKGMISAADVLIGRETYPEVDQGPRARECADVLARIWSDGLRPTMALYQIPMMWGMNQVTAHPPMSEAITELHRIEGQPGVVCGSIATCYPLADQPDMGASVYIVTDNDLALAQKYADELGNWLFERRTEWHFPIPPAQESLATAEAAGKFPAIFADLRDNTGGGSPGDSTGVLQTFIDAGLKDACVLYIVDPEAVAQCQSAGVGATLTLKVGAKSTPLQGDPIEMTAEVVSLSDGEFYYAAQRNKGLKGTMGPSAYIRQDGIHVLLVTQREQPFDTGFSHTMGLKPQEMRYISVKSAAHFRQGFESWAGAIYPVSEPSVHDPLNGRIQYHRLGRKLYPLDDI